MNAIVTTSEIAQAETAETTVNRFAGHAVIDREPFAAALAIVKLAPEKRNTIPILSNVLLAADGPNNLAMTATDLDMEIRIDLPAAVDDGFAATIPAHMLETFAKKAPASNMVAIQSMGESVTTKPSIGHEGQTFDTAVINGRATLDFERARYHVDALPVTDFPRMSKVEFATGFTMSGKDFWNMLDRTMGAISTEETRYYLNGVFMHYREFGNRGALIAVATDGHRLYRQIVDAPAVGADLMQESILPAKLVKTLHKLMKGKACPETVTVRSHAARIEVAFGGVTITSKLVDGTFPDYQRIIPTGNPKVATFDCAAMREAVAAVSLISSERGRAVKLTIEDGKARINVNNPDQGSAETEIEATLAEASDNSPYVEIGFNAKYVDDMLSDAGDGEIVAEFGDAGSPAIFRGRDCDWMAVLMPMRV